MTSTSTQAHSEMTSEWSDDGRRGLMMPYADPRAYSDRLNRLFTPAGWTRKYSVQASAPVQRSKRGPAAKILVTCEVTIGCIGTNSGTGEEWSDKENALTGAEAQAFKRALSCFGLGRYLYDVEGEWVEQDQYGIPKKKPKLPRSCPGFRRVADLPSVLRTRIRGPGTPERVSILPPTEFQNLVSGLRAKTETGERRFIARKLGSATTSR